MQRHFTEEVALENERPWKFYYPMHDWKSNFDRSLYDLEASINLMSLLVFKRLGLCKFKPSTICLQLVDRSLTYPWGVVEDVLVKVRKVILPVDFVVLDIKEDSDVPFILGRPFLATGGALIDMQNGGLTFHVNKEEMKFSINLPTQSQEERVACNRVESVEKSIVKT